MKKYIVSLSQKESQILKRFISSGKRSAKVIYTSANIIKSRPGRGGTWMARRKN